MTPIVAIRAAGAPTTASPSLRALGMRGRLSSFWRRSASDARSTLVHRGGDRAYEVGADWRCATRVGMTCAPRAVDTRSRLGASPAHWPPRARTAANAGTQRAGHDLLSRATRASKPLAMLLPEVIDQPRLAGDLAQRAHATAQRTGADIEHDRADGPSAASGMAMRCTVGAWLLAVRCDDAAALASARCATLPGTEDRAGRAARRGRTGPLGLRIRRAITRVRSMRADQQRRRAQNCAITPSMARPCGGFGAGPVLLGERGRALVPDMDHQPVAQLAAMP